ncbi:hypothetical protein [Streptomyces sp. NPDC057616]|uniref:hypothetical protein n=1 Tax=Streptomyces sp. NPDC057616 TaxID=3346183 RepID=UPI003697C75A
MTETTPEPTGPTPEPTTAPTADSAPTPTAGPAPAPGPAPAAGPTPESAAEPTAGPLPEFVVGPVSEVAGEPLPQPAPKRRSVRRIVAVAGSALLAAAVVAGVGYTVVTVNGADRDAGAAVWKFPEAKSAGDEKEPPARGLAGMLVKYADGWKRGPDLGEFSADAQLSGAQATALRKEALRNLPRTQRRQLEKLIDKQHIQGMAMRSYVREAGSSFFTDTAAAVTIELSQMQNRAAVRNISTSQNEFLGGISLFRKGPKIKGYKDAACFLPPKTSDSHEKLDSMLCSAYRGDVLVTVTSDGVKPFDAKGVAELLKSQLDRIAEPGEAV